MIIDYYVEQGPLSNSHAKSQCEDFETSLGKRDTSVTNRHFFISPHNAFFKYINMRTEGTIYKLPSLIAVEVFE